MSTPPAGNPLTAVRSSITGRELWLNDDAAAVLCLPQFSRARLRTAEVAWEHRLATLVASSRSGNGTGIRPAGRALASAVFSAQSEDELRTALGALNQYFDALPKMYGRKRRSELLTLLWRAGLVVLPGGTLGSGARSGHQWADSTTEFYGGFAPLLQEAARLNGAVERLLKRLILGCGGATEVGDISDAALAKYTADLTPPADVTLSHMQHEMRSLVSRMLQLLHDEQRRQYAEQPEVLALIPSSYDHILARRQPTPVEAVAVPRDSLKRVHFGTSWIRSSLTGREIQINPHATRFAVTGQFCKERLLAAGGDWETLHGQQVSRKQQRFAGYAHNETPHGHLGLTRALIARIRTVFVSTTIGSFATSLDGLLEEMVPEDSSTYVGGRQKRALEVMVVLWKHQLVMWPGREICGSSGKFNWNMVPDVTEEMYGPLAKPILEILGGITATSHRRVVSAGFLAASGVEEVGDLDQDCLATLAAYVDDRRDFHGFCDGLRLSQLRAYRDTPDVRDRIPPSYREILPKRVRPRSDHAFRWAVDAGHAHVESWREPVAAFFASISDRISLATELHSLNVLLDYVRAEVPPGCTPADYCRRTYRPPVRLSEFLSRTTDKDRDGISKVLKVAQRFFAYALLRDCSTTDGELQPGFHNPISDSDVPGQRRGKGQTHRTATPHRFLRMMQEIITEDDYAWPRTIQQDYFNWVDPSSGLVERVWSPVRAHLFVLRLSLPIRSIQARLLDSGEGDEEVLRREEGHLAWATNTGRWAEKNRALGFMRKIFDQELGKFFTGMFITTNKTADRATLFNESGYEIPWENPALVDLFLRQRDWQEKYNPSLGGQTRAALPDKGLQPSQDLVGRLPKYHFLFRDAADPDAPQIPPSQGRLSTFWYQLIEELERRLEAAEPPTRNEDGSRIELITKRSQRTGRATSSVFDPHSLRVSGLTLLAGAGVPLHVLSEFVAGHATVLMSLYYIKPGAGEVTRVLNAAAEKISETEYADFVEWLRESPVQALKDVVAFNTEAGLAAAAGTQSALWGLVDVGICPNGATRCHEGGAAVDGTSGRKAKYLPVLGGPKNCTLCRFLVSGPAFLGGLVAKFNETAGKIREKLGAHDGQTRRRREMETERAAYHERGEEYPLRKTLFRADEAIDALNAEIEVLTQGWTAQWRLIQRSLQILELKTRRLSAESDRTALVLNSSTAPDVAGGYEIRFEVEATEFDLWDRICQDSDFYPSVDATLPALRRAKLYDAMLTRNGRPGVFASLSDAQLVSVGNEVGRFLRTVLPDPTTSALMAGETSLREIGLEDGLDRLLAGCVTTPLKGQAVVAGSTSTSRLTSGAPRLGAGRRTEDA